MADAGAHGRRRHLRRIAMHWLYLLLAIGALMLAITTRSGGMLMLWLLATVGFLLAWVVGWYRNRIGEVSREEVAMVDPVELHRLRQLAEQRRREAAAQAAAGEEPQAR